MHQGNPPDHATQRVLRRFVDCTLMHEVCQAEQTAGAQGLATKKTGGHTRPLYAMYRYHADFITSTFSAFASPSGNASNQAFASSGEHTFL